MEMIGKLISGRYRLIAPLGEGGMATIWRAVDEQLDREVAVKLLREQYGNDAGFAARFKQEARAAGSLQHPNIVPVYDYGTDTDGAQFIVMQLVEGDDLAALLRERTRLETDDAVRVAIGVASALEAAHRRGLVHRDVKPGNILITDDGDVKVTDFGIARAVAEASMTVTGTTLGSVHYFSPEQARGDEVTGSSDVYSLGIVLYEMLTGRRPFEADSAAGVALKRLNEDPPPPESFVPLPSGLSAIVMRALQREPADRFPDAGSFAEALRTWQKDPSAAAAMPPRRGSRAQPPLPRSRPSWRAAPSTFRRRWPCHPTAPPPPPAATRPQEDEGQPWWVWALLVLGILLLGLIGYLGVEVFGGLGPDATPSPTPEQITLPDYEGQPIAAVRADLDRLGLVPDEEREPSDEFARNLVIRTDPDAGSEVSEGDTITVVISAGADTVAVPNLIGQTRGEASCDPERGRAAAWLGHGRAGGPGSGHRHPQRSGRGHRRRAQFAGEPGPVDRADAVPDAQPTPPPTPPPTPAPTATPSPEPT